MKTLSLTLIAGLTMSSLPALAKSDAVVSIGDSCLNFRSKASGRSNVKDCLDSGTKVTILKRNSRYSYVEVDGRKGYVWNNYLKPATTSSSVAAAPEASTASLSNPALSAQGDMFGNYVLPESQTYTHEKEQSRLSALFNEGVTARESANVVDQSIPKALPRGNDTVVTAQPAPTAPSNVNGSDVAGLSWNATQYVTNNLIGKNHGYDMNRRAGWAKISADGSVHMEGPKNSFCTSATHAQFLTTLGELHKKGLIKLDSKSVQALNSKLFQDTWNSDGHGTNKIIELLGGQNFSDVSLAKKGDFLKLDRARGGHTVIFSHVENGKVCYWSSNKKTRGPGIQCETMSGRTFTFGRLNDLQALQAGLDNLENDLRSDRSLSQVRREGSAGDVARRSIEIASARNLRGSPSIVNANGTQYADASKARRSFATAAAGGTL